MHTCDECMFCYYRKLRVAAFGAVDRAAPQEEGGPAFTMPPDTVTPASPLSPPILIDVDAALPELFH